ncbi:MAG: Cof-type family hydrolase [Lachnospiraceae bacterium]|jgi:Cof subfamily protein (haloacid dehalogenase superfamily)|nr:Cof-type family hydrolase [Lachnospiraceae bacterium]
MMIIPSTRKIKIIALDMDGTLLNDNKQVSRDNYETITQAMEQGIYIVPATGRIKSALPKEILNHPKISYGICSNGAAIMNLKTGNVLFRCNLNRKLVLDILEELAEFDIIIDIFADGKIMTEEENKKRLDEFEMSDLMKEFVQSSRTYIPCLVDFVTKEAVHIERFNIFYKTLEQKAALCKRLSKYPQVVIASSLFNNLEVNMQGADKGTALMWLANYLSIPAEETMAIGDSDNDTTMIKKAGIGVAMGNAIQDIKDVADDITLTNEEDGVAYSIRKYLF